MKYPGVVEPLGLTSPAVPVVLAGVAVFGYEGEDSVPDPLLGAERPFGVVVDAWKR